MKQKISLIDFEFRFEGRGHYKVTYTSPVTGKKWSCVTDDMELVDETKNAEFPKRKNLELLKLKAKHLR